MKKKEEQFRLVLERKEAECKYKSVKEMEKFSPRSPKSPSEEYNIRIRDQKKMRMKSRDNNF
jgi:hypothetical protein